MGTYLSSFPHRQNQLNSNISVGLLKSDANNVYKFTKKNEEHKSMTLCEIR